MVHSRSQRLIHAHSWLRTESRLSSKSRLSSETWLSSEVSAKSLLDTASLPYTIGTLLGLLDFPTCRPHTPSVPYPRAWRQVRVPGKLRVSYSSGSFLAARVASLPRETRSWEVDLGGQLALGLVAWLVWLGFAVLLVLVLERSGPHSGLVIVSLLLAVILGVLSSSAARLLLW